MKTTQEKFCTSCKLTKPFSDFRPYKGRCKDGLRPLCKDCQREYEKKWRKSSKEKLRKARWIRSPKAKEYARRYRAQFRAAYLIAEIRRRCAVKKIPFDLNLHTEEIQNRIKNGLCEVTGYPMDTTPLKFKYERRPNAPSIDRKNPKVGYIYSNIRIVCLAVNMMMGSWGENAVKPIIQKWMEKI